MKKEILVTLSKHQLFLEMADALNRINPEPSLLHEGYAWEQLFRAQVCLEELQGREDNPEGENMALINRLLPVMEEYLFELKDGYYDLRGPTLTPEFLASYNIDN